MNKTRIDAIERVAAIKVPATEKIGFDINEFGTDVFGIECMRERLPKPVFKTLYKTRPKVPRWIPPSPTTSPTP